MEEIDLGLEFLLGLLPYVYESFHILITQFAQNVTKPHDQTLHLKMNTSYFKSIVQQIIWNFPV